MGTYSSAREAVSRTRLHASQFAASEARRFTRTVLSALTGPSVPPSQALTDPLIDDAVLLVSELVTNAVKYAGTDIEVSCRPEPGAVVVEVADRHPASPVSARGDLGLQLVGTLAESWGVTYRCTEKVTWFRLETTEAEPEPSGFLADELHQELRGAGVPAAGRPRDDPGRLAEWADRAGPSYLAEASELLAGQLDEDMVAALAGQLLVPRLADWCGVWLSTDSGGVRLSRVWHTDEQRIDPLRRSLEQDPPPVRLGAAGTPWPWPEGASADGSGGSALAFPLVSGGEVQGMMLIGRGGLARTPEGLIATVEDVARRVAQAVLTARYYTRQTTISLALQRRQLPPSLASIPGVETALVYEPHSAGQTVGGDFYDLFPNGEGRWCFLLGDVQGKDPEAMSITGLARHLVRLLAREGHGVESVLRQLNLAMAEETEEATASDHGYAQPRFLSLLYGEVEPHTAEGGARCTVASAGHPPPLRLAVDGSVAPVVAPQMLLGIDGSVDFSASSFELAPGETLLCVTDGVTERRNGTRQLDDDDGLSRLLSGYLGLGAKAVAERVRRAVHDFGPEPVGDDLAVLVLHAVHGT